jgi:hypothetical protein
MVMANNLAKDGIDCGNIGLSESHLRPAAVSVAKDNIMKLVIAECEGCKIVRVWRYKRGEFQRWNLYLKEGGPGSLYPWREV